LGLPRSGPNRVTNAGNEMCDEDQWNFTAQSRMRTRVVPLNMTRTRIQQQYSQPLAIAAFDGNGDDDNFTHPINHAEHMRATQSVRAQSPSRTKARHPQYHRVVRQRHETCLLDDSRSYIVDIPTPRAWVSSHLLLIAVCAAPKSKALTEHRQTEPRSGTFPA
jgi:uncharacterized protein with NAD-binding domain and iron-sulfur cluster